MDEGQRPLKTGSLGIGDTCLCGNDATYSKPLMGRNVVDVTQSDSRSVCNIVCCEGRKCKTCCYLIQSSTFSSNVTGRTYSVNGQGEYMNCGTKNVIYLISCKKCGVQYVGEMSQTERKIQQP